MRIWIFLGSFALSMSMAAAALPASGNNGSGGPGAAPEIQIQDEALSPDSVKVAQGRTFVFLNNSSSIASIEFHLDQDEAIPCMLDDGNQPLGRTLIIGRGNLVRCTAAVAGEYEFWVLRKNGPLKGMISVR